MPIRKQKENCCVRVFRKIFKTLYPINAKTAWTSQGKWLRTCIGVAVFLHCFFFIFSLALVGFPSMIINLMLASWSYSVYLTLNEWKVCLYFFFLMSSTFTGLVYGLEQKKDGMQKMGLIVNCCFYILNIWFIGKAYWDFRKTGGIKGLKPTTNLAEERAMKKAGQVAGKAGDFIDKKVDQENQR